MKRSRCCDDGWRLRPIAAGKPCRDSLMPSENSLFAQINSLFRRKFSLFDRVGNSIKEANHCRWLGRRVSDDARNRENSLYFPWLSGNRPRRRVRCRQVRRGIRGHTDLAAAPPRRYLLTAFWRPQKRNCGRLDCISLRASGLTPPRHILSERGGRMLKSSPRSCGSMEPWGKPLAPAVP
jgi:hypothetical protein